jgi:hypothetical protein
MPSITKDLKLDLGVLAKSTNTKRTVLELKSEVGASLTLSPEDATVESLVDVASKGGGKISLKVTGISKKITTTESIKETTIHEAIITTADPKELTRQLELLLE